MKTASTTDLIMDIDLGKCQSVACLYEPASAEVQYDRFTTGPAELRRLIGRHRPVVVGGTNLPRREANLASRGLRWNRPP